MNHSLPTPCRRFLHQTAQLAGGALASRALSASPAPVDPPATTPLEDIVTLADAEAAAGAVTPRDFFDFVQGGAADEITIVWNQEKYREIHLRTRVLKDVGTLDTATTLFGCAMAAPILFAPTSSNRILHPEGELAVARAAGATGTPPALREIRHPCRRPRLRRPPRGRGLARQRHRHQVRPAPACRPRLR